MFTDSHAHLESLENLDDSLEGAKAAGVGAIVTIGTDLESSKQAFGVVEKYSTSGFNIFATGGIHPGDGKGDVDKFGIEECVDKLRMIITGSKMVGVGETGLDYREASDQNPGTSDKDKEYQRNLFVAQLKLADELKLPLIVHCRNAWHEIFELLTVNRKLLTSSGVFHSFTGGPDEAKRALDLGFYVSFSGIVTFKNASALQSAAKVVPLDRMLIETDSPYLAPEPIRGSKNEPKHVTIIGQFLAKHLGLPIGRIEEQTTTNARSLFKLS